MITQTAPSVRYSDVRFGDTLQSIALREFGDASRWVELAVLNKLREPYVGEIASPTVLAYGDMIKVPSASSAVSADADPAFVYGIDILVRNGQLVADGDDFSVVSGVQNFVQALRHHIQVDKRELAFHPDFGCYVRSVIGSINGPTAGQMAAFYVKSALLEDERVDFVASCTAEVLGDQIKVFAVVHPISGKPVDLILVV